MARKEDEAWWWAQQKTDPEVSSYLSHYDLLMDLRMYMSTAEIKNPLTLIDEYMQERGIHGS